MHIGPVQHGLVARVADWPYSPFYRLVAHGVYPAHGDGSDVAGVFDKGINIRRNTFAIAPYILFLRYDRNLLILNNLAVNLFLSWKRCRC